MALAVAPIFVVNGFRVLAHDWFVRYELGRDEVPADRYGLSARERLDLALTGLHSIRPESAGIALLEAAKLPDGLPAFDARELRHMADVRRMLGAAYKAQLVALVLLVVAALALARSSRWRTVVPRGLQVGSALTLAVAVLAIPVILLGFEGFFLRFHEIFFSGNSWRFSNTDTLLRLYPEELWQDTSQLIAGIVLGQAVVVALAATWWLRRLAPRSAS